MPPLRRLQMILIICLAYEKQGRFLYCSDNRIKYQLMKILFCPERVNLVACGDQITDLKFQAGKHGPVPYELYSEITERAMENLKQGNNIRFLCQKISGHKILEKELERKRLERGDKEETINFSFFSN